MQWQPIETGPRNATWVRVKLADGTEVDAHYADGDGDGLMPAYRGWFVRRGDYFAECYMDVIAMQAVRLIDSAEARRRILALSCSNAGPTYAFPQDVTSQIQTQIIK